MTAERADGRRSRGGFWRTLGRGIRGVWDALELVDNLLRLLRILTWPLRFIARALDSFW